MIEDTKSREPRDGETVAILEDDQVEDDQAAPATASHAEPAAASAAAPTVPVLSDPSGLLTADEILAGADVTRLESVEIEVGEWTPGWTKDNEIEPRKVRIRVMTGDEAMEFAAAQDDQRQKDTLMRLVCTCAVNEGNEPIFNEQQLSKIGALSFGVLQRLQNAALILNGFAEEEKSQEAAGNA